MMEQFIKEIEEALSEDLKWFDITAGEVIDEDPEFYSVTVNIRSKDFEHDGIECTGKTQPIHMQLDEGKPCLLLGEDHLQDITKLAIYRALFWDLALTPAPTQAQCENDLQQKLDLQAVDQLRDEVTRLADQVASLKEENEQLEIRACNAEEFAEQCRDDFMDLQLSQYPSSSTGITKDGNLVVAPDNSEPQPLDDCTDTPFLLQQVKFLWKLLDDIDTAGDVAKWDDVVYREMVEHVHRQRHQNISSDGYRLFVGGDNHG